MCYVYVVDMDSGKANDPKKTFEEALCFLREAGFDIECTYEELMEFLSATTYEDEKTAVDEILNNFYLLIHEILEMCELKNLGTMHRKIFFLGHISIHTKHT